MNVDRSRDYLSVAAYRPASYSRNSKPVDRIFTAVGHGSLEAALKKHI
jgi:hypothetical protein